MTKRSWATSERAELSDLLDEVGPDAPTLCGDWTTRDLAAHLIIRESRPDAAAGIVLKPLAGWTERVQQKAADKPWESMVEAIRTGPPTLSAFSFPKADSLLNTSEYFVHLEDVRRAGPDWEPRVLPAKFSDSLWSIVKGRAKAFHRKSSVGVVLVRADKGAASDQITAKHGDPVVTVTGPAAELLLFSFGRQDHARVELTGSPEAVAALVDTEMGV